MKTRIWIAFLAALLFLSLGAAALLYFGKAPAGRAEIYSDGTLTATVDLGADQVFTVSSPNGGRNTVTVRQGKIAVTQATCPDQWCVRQGFHNRGGSIVCLPNRLVIVFLSGEPAVDAPLR